MSKEHRPGITCPFCGKLAFSDHDSFFDYPGWLCVCRAYAVGGRGVIFDEAADQLLMKLGLDCRILEKPVLTEIPGVSVNRVLRKDDIIQMLQDFLGQHGFEFRFISQKEMDFLWAKKRF